MSIFARFRAIDRKSACGTPDSTPDFDYFYMVALSIGMATLGLIADSGSIVIGSMLIAPVLYPILSFSVGMVMSDYKVLSRAVYTIFKSVTLGLVVSILVALMFAHNIVPSEEILNRTEPSLLYLFVAIVAGMAVSYTLAKVG